MKNFKRILLTVVAAMLLVVMSVAGTLAYLTSTSQEVKNTFTVGDVNIILDEAQIIDDGTKSNHDVRVLENSYKLQPGLTYKKDPTVTVLKGSEDCYVRAQVTISDYSKLKDAFPVDRYADYWVGDVFLLEMLVNGTWDKATWIPQAVTAKKTDTSVTYEFWYKEIVTSEQTKDGNKVLDDLFEEIKLPDDMTNTELSYLKDMKINVVAHAIQAEGFDDAADAWATWKDATVEAAKPTT